MMRFVVTAVVLSVTLAASGARADVVPPAPAADDCTVDKQCKDGQTCPTLAGEIDKDCAAGMTKSGMTLKCTQNKVTGGKAVYCPAAKKGCGKSSIAPAPTSGAEGGVALGLLATALAASALRRARSRRSQRR